MFDTEWLVNFGSSFKKLITFFDVLKYAHGRNTKVQRKNTVLSRFPSCFYSQCCSNPVSKDDYFSASSEIFLYTLTTDF